MLPRIESDFEKRLVSALQPVRQFALAQVLYHFMDSGLYEVLDLGPRTAATIGEQLQMDKSRVEGVLTYLVNEGYVRRDGGAYSLTSKVRETKIFQPWYQLLVGGYCETFQQIGRVLHTGADYATRSGADVGEGSCGISRYDALPLMLRLLEPIRNEIRQVVDLGCGSGLALADFVEHLPGTSALGIDPEPASIRRGTQLMRDRGLDERIQLRTASAWTAPGLVTQREGVCFTTAFVLQEMLEQGDRAQVVKLISEVFARHPSAYWIVIEVDNQSGNRNAMAHELATAYYNPYFLIHHLTQQRLESDSFWKNLFQEADADIMLQITTDSRVDSTEFELGYLLRSGTRGGTS